MIFVALDNVRSNENVGSIFRTCDAAGVSKVFLCGYTPAPVDRFGRENRALTKASLGAEKFIEWEKVEKLSDLIERLKDQKIKIVAIEQDQRAIDYREIKKFGPIASGSSVALVFGNEVNGLSKDDLDACDKIMEIPMKGQKESLNVAVSVGIALFSLYD